MIRDLLRDSAVYFVPTLLARGIGLILLPVYTRYLSPADYGVVEMLTVLYTLLNLVLPLEISQAVARFSAEQPDAARRSRFLSTAFWFTALVFAGWLALAALFPGGLAAALTGRDDPLLLPAAAAAMLANALLYLALNQLRWNLQRRGYVVASLLFTLVLASVSVTLIVAYGLGVYGVIWGQLAGSVLALACAIGYLSAASPVSFRFSRGDFGELLAYSRPLVVSSLAVYLTSYSDRWMLGMWEGMESVGIYSVALRIAGIITLFTTSVQFALTPLVYSRHRESTTPASIARFFQYYLLAALALIAVVAGFSGEIVALVAGARFAGAREFVGPVLLATLVLSLNVFAPGLSIARLTSRIAIANGAGAAACVAATAAFIPALGPVGAAIGTLTGASMAMAMRFAWSQRCYPIPYRWGRYAAAAGVLVVLLGLTATLDLAAGARAILVLAGIAAFAWLLLDRAEWPLRRGGAR